MFWHALQQLNDYTDLTDDGGQEEGMRLFAKAGQIKDLSHKMGIMSNFKDIVSNHADPHSPIGRDHLVIRGSKGAKTTVWKRPPVWREPPYLIASA